MADEDEGLTLDLWQQLKDLADRAKAEGWTPERMRGAIAEVVVQTPEVDETDKPAA